MNDNKENLFLELPIIPLRGIVVFPKMVLHFDVGRRKSVKALQKAMDDDQRVFLVCQKDASVDEPNIDDMYDTGVICNIRQMMRIPGSDNMRVVVEGGERAILYSLTSVKPYVSGLVELASENPSNLEIDEDENRAYQRIIKREFEHYASLMPKISNEVIAKVISIKDSGELADFVCSNTFLDYYEKQDILAALDPADRICQLVAYLKKENTALEIESEIQEKVQNEIDKSQREYYLREEMKVISDALGEGDNPQEEAEEYRDKINALKCNKDIKEKLLKECDKLSKMPSGSHEGTVERIYLDKCLEIPFGKYTKDSINLEKSRKILDKEHYGLDKIKDRIVDSLAVYKRNPDFTGQILCLAGPPGVGKTTLAQIIANKLETPFYTLSAVTSGVKDVREVIDRAKSNRFFSQSSPILFIDEIHRFSKSQQDSLLGAVENGTVTLIGATTENPSFEVIRPLLSRCQLYVLKSLEKEDLLELLQRAITTDAILKERKIELKETTAMLRFSGGDARKLLNILELVVQSETEETVVITDEMVTERLQQNPLAYDKDGEMHYDIISAFIKSIRGSDPDGAIYWLARMVEGGEDPAFIARRLVISAAEDIGLANPNALLLANACFDTLMKIGWPEGRIPLAETTIYLATSPKSNSAYSAINDALELVRSTGNLPVPLHLRNAPTKLMKQLGYGQEYKYAHSYEGNFVKQQFLPDELKDKRIWQPQNNPAEQKHAERMIQLWGDKFKK